tara:strand:- start:302 stop:574 length:273 start_codon:yes stop_codon:yes gene_type:complete
MSKARDIADIDQQLSSGGSPTFVNISPTGTVDGRDIAVDGAKLDGLNNLVESDATGVTGADVITNMMSLTTAEYAAITPDAATLYIIKDV